MGIGGTFSGRIQRSIFWPARAHHSFRLLFKVDHSTKEFASRHSCHRSDLMRRQAQYSDEILAPHLHSTTLLLLL